MTIAVPSSTTFTYTVGGSLTTPATGTILYNENVSVKFTLPFGHSTDAVSYTHLRAHET